MAGTKAEEALNLSLDDIIKRNRDSIKPRAKAEKNEDGERKPRGSLRGRGRNSSDGRVAVVKVVQTKRAAAGRPRAAASGTFVDYDGSLHVVSGLAAASNWP